MWINCKKLWIVFLCAAFSILIEVNTSASKWLNNLPKSIQNHDHVYQVMLLFNQSEETQNSQVDNIVSTLSKWFPTRKVSFQDATEEKALKLSQSPPFKEPRATTIFVIVHFSRNLSPLTDLIKFLRGISENRSRPKCLMILSEETIEESYERILRFTWSKNFLDTSILEITEVTTRKGNDLLNFSTEIPILHHFNPFTNISTKVRDSELRTWFPDKTRDLGGYSINVGIFNRPPDIFLKLNGRGQVQEVRGIDLVLTEALSRVMNFKIVWHPSQRDDVGSPNCDKDKNTGLLYKVMHSEVQFIANRIGVVAACNEQFFDWSTVIRPDRLCSVVPISYGKTPSLSVEWKVHKAIGLIIFLLFMMMVSKILDFEPRNWKLMYLVQVLLAMGTPREPQRIVERIVFGSILIACLLYSSFIYTAFTDVSLTMESDEEYSSMNDLLSSNLKHLIKPSHHFIAYPYSDGNLRRLLDNLTLKDMKNEECLSELVQYRNVTCNCLSEDTARYYMQFEKDDNDRPVMKILNEYFQSIVSSLPVEPSSPYIERFNDVILQVLQSGIVEKQRRMNVDKLVISQEVDVLSPEEEMQSRLINRETISILIIGYAASILIFLVEILIAFITKKDRSGRGTRRKMQTIVRIYYRPERRRVAESIEESCDATRNRLEDLQILRWSQHPVQRVEN